MLKRTLTALVIVVASTADVPAQYGGDYGYEQDMQEWRDFQATERHTDIQNQLYDIEREYKMDHSRREFQRYLDQPVTGTIPRNYGRSYRYQD